MCTIWSSTLSAKLIQSSEGVLTLGDPYLAQARDPQSTVGWTSVIAVNAAWTWCNSGDKKFPICQKVNKEQQGYCHYPLHCAAQECFYFKTNFNTKRWHLQAVSMFRHGTLTETCGRRTVGESGTVVQGCSTKQIVPIVTSTCNLKIKLKLMDFLRLHTQAQACKCLQGCIFIVSTQKCKCYLKCQRYNDGNHLNIYY